MAFRDHWVGVNRYMINEPGTFFEAYDEEHELRYPLVFMLVSFLAVVVPTAVLGILLNLSSPGTALASVFAFGVLGVIFWLITVVEGLLAHGVAMLFGARGVATSLEAYAFPTVVRYGLWWFPGVNVGLAIYGLVLQAKAFIAFHDLSPVKAGLAVVLAALLAVPAFLLILAVFVVFVIDIGPSGGAPPA